MSFASVAPTCRATDRDCRRRASPTALLWLAVFLGGFVFFEPAPYDLFLALLIPAWLLLGLTIPRAIGPLVVLMLLFLAGGVDGRDAGEGFLHAAGLLRRHRASSPSAPASSPA